jgi:pSer/pThr/pTyr-binding forkhead associated (FHA) protein
LPPPPPPPGAGTGGRSADEISGATRILSRPRLVERGNGDGNREHQLALGRTSIGRASDNLVHLLDEAVSRHHAEIVLGADGYLLRDLGSENGIYVNGDRTDEHLLRDGDVIQIGARTLVYRGA